MRVISFGAVSALALAFASPVVAQPSPTVGNLEKLGNFRQTGTPEMAHIPQSGPKAEAISVSARVRSSRVVRPATIAATAGGAAAPNAP